MKFKPTNLPVEKRLPKLVRDNIVAIMQAQGKDPKWVVAKSDKEFQAYLLKKLQEEVAELTHATSEDNFLEELADLEELLETIRNFKGWKRQGVGRVQKAKRTKNGGFAKRHILKSF